MRVLVVVRKYLVKMTVIIIVDGWILIVKIDGVRIILLKVIVIRIVIVFIKMIYAKSIKDAMI